MGEDDLLFEDVKASMSISFDVVKQLIKDIDEEIELGNYDDVYETKEGYKFYADVGYVADWWREYRPILIERYNLDL